MSSIIIVRQGEGPAGRPGHCNVIMKRSVVMFEQNWDTKTYDNLYLEIHNFRILITPGHVCLVYQIISTKY